mmetsp:Transcript_31421/g.30769  ORF Transcript_31421/g.30769 Transcript_31421/m.30769 type:complete len:134 (-) Transcript_31421:794-1195(-)
MEAELALQFFPEARAQSQLSQSQVKQEQSIQEVENSFMDQFEVDDEPLIEKINRKAYGKIPTPSKSFHTFLAMSLNCGMILASTPFKVLPKISFGVFFLVSLFVTFRCLQGSKSYSIFDFEELYAFLKKKSRL